MGGCVSTSSKSTCSSWSNGDKPVPRPYRGIGCCVNKRAKRTFSDHIVSLQNLSCIPNRITTSSKSRSSCIFTQQGRKGINQDAMIVWETLHDCESVLGKKDSSLRLLLIPVSGESSGAAAAVAVEEEAEEESDEDMGFDLFG